MTDTADFTESAAVYSLFLVFAETELIESRASADEALRLTRELDQVMKELGEEHVTVRGAYDLTGFDTSASVMIWLTSETVDDLQWAKRQLHRTQILGDTLVVESILAMAVSELDEEPRMWLSLAPVSPAPADEEFDDEEFEDGEIDDPDVDNLDEDFEDAELEADEVDDEELDDEELDDEESYFETTSLHAQIGIGPIRLFAAVEADEPGELIGPSIDLLENALMTVATPRTGRMVTPAELYEILR